MAGLKPKNPDIVAESWPMTPNEALSQIVEFRAKLDALAAKNGAKRKKSKDIVSFEATRAEMLALIRGLIEALSPMTDLTIGKMENGGTVVTEHSAMALLRQFTEALSDLDNARTHPVFAPNQHAANRTLPSDKKQEEAILKQAVEIKRLHKKFKSRAKAQHSLAQDLRKAGKTIKGKPATAAALKSIIRHPKKP
jgi:hypothetical protein